jgi:hypothetical protein
MNFWFFNLGAHKPVDQWARRGKPEWPELITVRMNKRQAIAQLASLARQLEARQEEEDFEMQLTGQLVPYPKD